MKPAVILALKILALTIILLLCFAVASAVVRLPDNPQASEATGAVLPLLAVCFLEATILSYLILRSRWTGWPLAAAVFFVFYGVTTVMSQSESAVFLTRLPPGVVPKLFALGALIAAPLSVLAVLILGKSKGAVDMHRHSRLVMSTREWTWKLAVIAVAYVVLYFTFGYFVAWRNPAVLQYYDGIDEGSFFLHMGTVLRETPWLIAFQVLRALCWAALGLLVIRMLKGERLETVLVVAVLFGVLMTARLLLPNPYMPEPVRIAHLVETASSNFIFGMLVGWLLSGRKASPTVAVLQGVG